MKQYLYKFAIITIVFFYQQILASSSQMLKTELLKLDYSYQYTQAPYSHSIPIIMLTIFQYKQFTMPSISSLHMQISELKATNHSQNRNFKNVKL